MFLLDTNICIYIIKKKPPAVLARFEQIDPSALGISIVTLAELEYGAAKSSNPQKNYRVVEDFVRYLDVFSWDRPVSRIYAEIRADLNKKGTPIGLLDTQIAAHCLSLDRVLVTNNEREFLRVPGLSVENWA
ncbi:type II toxin-antitoxin system VapC family toxin [Synechocystis sp. LKSZ1]|uniref:type II toxin-antitoxin system tRNA(fMet)-specific endonuclease VapC n=1 Tax=Synechocystis sp. LKSZ1 TaxID=3144951 RepID=UPI00336BE685